MTAAAERTGRSGLADTAPEGPRDGVGGERAGIRGTAVGQSIIEYDTATYDFAGWARWCLGVADLSRIHERADVRAFAVHDLIPQIELVRSALVRRFDRCRPTYLAFIRQVLAPTFGPVRAYQLPPSFRVHYSGRGSSSMHRDRDYGVPSGRLNAWIPLTDVWGENSLWLESAEGTADFAAVELSYGQVLIFDGANLLHGSRWNSTPATRISFDLRFSTSP